MQISTLQLPCLSLQRQNTILTLLSIIPTPTIIWSLVDPHPHSESGATVFLPDGDANDSSIVVALACRGSANLKNFSTNLKFNLVLATKLSMYVPEDALVHEGFQDASLGLWNELGPKHISSPICCHQQTIYYVQWSHNRSSSNKCIRSFKCNLDMRINCITKSPWLFQLNCQSPSEMDL
jgi:hypothetical protein